MRKRFEVQLALGRTPIERVEIPLKSRDELAPILAGLQWTFQNAEVSGKVLGILEERLSQGKKDTGRPGLTYWEILVLGVVRLGLDCDYDRLEDLANHHTLIRQIMGLPPVREPEEKPFHQKTLSQNVCHVDEELLSQINAVIVEAGRPLFKKKENVEPIQAKADTYVLETNVHYPTDLNLLWDAQRKCADLLEPLVEEHGISGWRKVKLWRRKLKRQMIELTRIIGGGGAHKEQRKTKAIRTYLQDSDRFESKINETLRKLPAAQTGSGMLKRLELDYFHTAMMKQFDLIERRLVQGETIPHQEKVFSLFEPHTEFIKKGKLFPPVELGHKVLLTTDQHGLILDYRVMEQPHDKDEVIALADRLLGRYGLGNIRSLSFDKGFTREEDRQLLELYIPEVIMPKRGKRNVVEEERENQGSFQRLRRKHHAVESDINCLEHHGLNRCPDKGYHGYTRYTGFGVLAYNLHKIGQRLIEREGSDRPAYGTIQSLSA